MFDFVAKHKRIVQFVLALITLPFAFFGVDYYFRRGGSAGEVATFDGGTITQASSPTRCATSRTDACARSWAVDPAMFDNPEVRYTSCSS